MPSKSTIRRSALAIAASSSLANAGPCDIYGNCIAAHATTRALYNAYNGPLYQVKRDSDKSTIDIKPVSAGGVANAAAQDTFCSGTTCLITQIYDQSGRGNHLTQAPPGGAASGPEAGGYDNLASAIGAPVTLGGKKAYGVFISPGTGYRNNKASGTATGDGAEGMYAVLDGTHYNDGCCFDYGNAETNNKDTGNGHMEAIYYGNNTIWGSGAGSGPWLMADLENGLFSGRNVKQNTNDPTITNRFFTAVVKGKPNEWALRGGNAASGGLSTYYDGVRPDASGYNPMSKEGAILLGIGGDNSISGQGTFYEGVMTSSYPSDDTENKVQANIVAAGYAKAAMTSGPAVTVGKTYSFKATTPGYDTRYLAASGSAAGSAINTQVLTTSSSTASKQAASWTVRTGLGNADCVSFENKQTPGSYLRHYNFALRLDPNDGTKSMHEDATFCPQTAFNSKGTNAFRAWGYPTRFVRHVNNLGYIAENGGTMQQDSTTSFTDDVSWVVGSSLA